MMKKYARITVGVVAEVVTDFTDESGNYFSIEQLFPPDFVTELVQVTGIVPEPSQNWTYDGKTFAPPVDPVLSPEQVLEVNTAQQQALMAAADLANYGKADAFVAGLLDAADTTTFKAWSEYKLALSKVDLTQVNPAWPTAPQF